MEFARKSAVCQTRRRNKGGMDITLHLGELSEN